MPRLEKLVHPGMEAYIFECPGCGMDHMIVVSRTPEYDKVCSSKATWTFNGDIERPTFSPSLLVRSTFFPLTNTCHSFVRNGKIEFLGDCTHKLKGQTVDLPEVET